MRRSELPTTRSLDLAHPYLSHSVVASRSRGGRGVRPYIRHFFPRRRILEVKARPWQALKVGSG